MGILLQGLQVMKRLFLFLIGVGLIVAEFFLPHGIAGIIGALAIIGSIIIGGRQSDVYGDFCPYRGCYRCYRDGDYYEIFR